MCEWLLISLWKYKQSENQIKQTTNIFGFKTKWFLNTRFKQKQKGTQTQTYIVSKHGLLRNFQIREQQTKTIIILTYKIFW